MIMRHDKATASSVALHPANLATATGILAAATWFFARVFTADIPTDLQKHLDWVVAVMNGQVAAPANFLYYEVLRRGAELSGVQLWVVAVGVLAASVCARYALTSWILAKESGAPNSPRTRVAPIVLVGLALTVAFSLPTTRPYLGQLPPNVWHNSTTIFLLPFALLLFLTATSYLRRPHPNLVLAMCLLAMINVAIKPSYFFLFASCFPLMCLRAFRLGRETILGWIPVAVGGLLLVLQYSILYGDGSGESSVVLAPFRVWSAYSWFIPWSIGASILFPVVTAVFLWDEVKDSTAFQFAALSMAVAICITALFAESGPRAYHGNFFWQSIVANYMLFLTSASLVIQHAGARGWRGMRILGPTAALSLHTAYGIWYLIRFQLERTFV